jgi:protein TonB
MQRKNSPATHILKAAVPLLLGLLGTLLLFMVLPITQRINERMGEDSTVRAAPVVVTPPPPEMIEEEPPPEDPEPEEPPEMVELDTNLSLDQLNLDATAGNLGGASFGADISSLIAKATQQVGQDIFDSGMLDSRPKPIFQSPPRYPNELRSERKKGQVYVVFVVNKNGRVENPVAKRATHPAFEKAAIDAIRQWKFEPATRGGEAVSAKMSQPITFNPPG